MPTVATSAVDINTANQARVANNSFFDLVQIKANIHLITNIQAGTMEQPWPGNISRKRRNAIVPTEGFFDNLDAPPETIDERIMKAIGKLNSLPSAVEAQGNEAIIMVTRKAERSLRWVHNHEGEIEKRAMVRSVASCCRFERYCTDF